MRRTLSNLAGDPETQRDGASEFDTGELTELMSPCSRDFTLLDPECMVKDSMVSTAPQAIMAARMRREVRSTSETPTAITPSRTA